MKRDRDPQSDPKSGFRSINAEWADDIDMYAAENDFEVICGSSSMLLKIVDALKDLMKECVLEFEKAGVKVQTMDTARVALIDLFLRSGAFIHYEMHCGGIDCGIDIMAFHKILQRGNSGDQLWMWKRKDEEVIRMRFYDITRSNIDCLKASSGLEEDRITVDGRFDIIEGLLARRIDMGRVAIKVGSKEVQKSMCRGDVDVKYYEMSMQDVEGQGMDVPRDQVRPSAELTIGSKMFQKVVDDLGGFGDTMVIKVTDEGVKLMISGDVGQGSYLLKRRVEEKMDRFVDMKLHEEKIGQSFSVRYLNSFVKGGELGDKVTMELYRGQPFLMHFDVIHRDNGWLNFYIAPKLSASEEQ